MASRKYTFYVYISRNKLEDTFFFSHSLEIRANSFILASKKMANYESWINANSIFSCVCSWTYYECIYKGDSSLGLTIPF